MDIDIDIHLFNRAQFIYINLVHACANLRTCEQWERGITVFWANYSNNESLLLYSLRLYEYRSNK